MKTVMAEAASLTARRDSAGTGELSQRFSHQKTPQRERKKFQGPSEISLDGTSAVRSGSSPWKLPPAPVSPTNSPPLTPSTSMNRTHEAFPPPSAAPSTPPRQRGPQPPQPNLGPVFTPSRQPTSRPASSSIRRASSNNKAWSQSLPAPVAAPSSPAAVSGVSFVAIQQLQLEQGTPSSRDKRSLREIQEEERARQAEEIGRAHV